MHLKKLIAVLLIFSLLFVNFIVDASAESEEYSGFLVGLSEGVIMPLSMDSSLEYVTEGVYKSESVTDVIEYIDAGVVEYIEPNYYVELMADDNISNLSELKTIYDNAGAYGQMKASAAAQSSNTGQGIRIAVIDSGLDLSFGDFNSSNIERYTVYSDGLYYDSTIPNANHGTRVVDVIAGIHSNGIGVDGLAPGATIVSIKVYNSEGSTVAQVVAAIEKATIDLNCDIINLSMGTSETSTALNEAIDKAVIAGVIVIAAAGNSATSGNPVMYPASYDTVVSVGAAGTDYSWQTYSCFNEYVDCLAPGTLVFRTPTYDGFTYWGGRGTSYASPAVAAAAALMLQAYPDMTPAGFQTLLQTKSMDLGNSGRDHYYGYGFVRVDWLLSNEAVLFDAITADSVITLSVVLQVPDVTNVIAANYSQTGKMLDVDIVTVNGSSFCRTYTEADTTLKLYFLGSSLSPVVANLVYPTS